ncbi:MAG: PAS domain S-box protein, partial [Rhodospirillaceae bacterium]|nr:PAS domain S-box protein [Rhodospirillaceae bacterium]
MSNRIYGKRWLFAAVVASLVVVMLGVYSIGRIESSFKETVSDLLLTTLDGTVNRIERWERERVNDVRVLASSSDVVQATQNFLYLKNNGYLSPQASAAKSFVESKILPGLKAWGGVNYFIISPDGKVIASTSGTRHSVSNEISENPDILNAVLSGETIMKFLPHEGKSGHYEIYVAAPITSGKKPISVLVFELDPRDDFAEIVNLGRGRNTMETYAITPDGTMLNESRFTEKLYDIGLLEKGQESIFNIHVRDPGGDMTSGYRSNLQTNEMPLTKMAAGALNKESSINIQGYRDYRGVRVAGAWKWIDGLGIGIASEIDYREAFNTMDELRLEIIILAVVSSVLILGFAAYFHISRRKMWESAHRTRTVLDSALDGMIVINEKGIVETVNVAAVKMFGYQEREVIGHNIKMLMPEPYKSAHDGYLERYTNTGERKIIGIGREVIGRRKDGSEFPMDLAVAEMQLQ